MANEDPFAGFNPQDDPFAGFNPPAKAAPPQNLTYLPDFMNNWSRSFENAFTGGLSDRVHSWLRGDNVAEERGKTEAARAALGPVGSASADIVGFGMSPISKVMPGGVIGGTVGGAALGAGQALAEGTNPYTGAAEGAGLGAGAGVASKVLNPIARGVANKVGKWIGALSSPEAITDTAEAAKTAAYDKLNGVFYNPNDVQALTKQIQSSIDIADPGGGMQSHAPRSMAALNSLAKNASKYPTQTAHDIVEKLDALRDATKAGPAAGSENAIAPIIEQHLNDFLARATPVNPNVQPGQASQMLKDAKDAFQTYANARDLQNWSENLSDFGASPRAEAISKTKFYDRGSDPFNALKDIANTAGGGEGVSAWGAMHAVHPWIEDATHAGLGALGVAGGVPGAVAAGLTYGVAKPGLGKALTASQRAATQRSIQSGYPVLTGQRTTFDPNLAPALRAVLFGGARY